MFKIRPDQCLKIEMNARRFGTERFGAFGWKLPAVFFSAQNVSALSGGNFRQYFLFFVLPPLGEIRKQDGYRNQQPDGHIRSGIKL